MFRRLVSSEPHGLVHTDLASVGLLSPRQAIGHQALLAIRGFVTRSGPQRRPSTASAFFVSVDPGLAPKFYPIPSSLVALGLPGWAVVATGAGAEPSA